MLDDRLPGTSPAERVTRTAALSVVLGLGVVGTLSKIGLYADGSYYLLRILSESGPFMAVPGRDFAMAVTQAPLLLFLELGVRDLDLILLIHSAGLVLIPSAVWFSALWLQRRSPLFWLFVMMWVATFLVAGFFSIGEYNLTYALAALSASVMFPHGDQRISRALLLIPVSLVLLRSYESMVFLGPLLSSIAVLAMLKARPRPGLRAIYALTALLLVGAAVGATATLLSPEHPGRIGAGLNPRVLAEDPRLLLASLAAAGLGLVLFVSNRRASGFLVAALAVTPLPVALLILVPDLRGALPVPEDPTWPSISWYYNGRIAVGGLMWAILMVSTYLYFSGHHLAGGVPAKAGIPGVRQGYWLIPAAAATSLSLVFIADSLGFHQWVGDFRHEVRTRTGLTTFEAAAIDPKFAASWTNPSLSVVLQGHPSQGVIQNPQWYEGWQPFDPESRVPKLPETYRR